MGQRSQKHRGRCRTNGRGHKAAVVQESVAAAETLV